MTIRLTKLAITPNGDNTLFSLDSDTTGRAVAFADSREEAETARLAFERVLLPRFTADEAIAVCLKQAAPEEDHIDTWLPVEREFYLAGMRAALEGLYAAGVFVPDEGAACSCSRVTWEGEAPVCANCNGTGRVTRTMADKLDAAGIK